MCKEDGCKESFKWTVGEQEFFERNGFQQPRYCGPHREARKAARNRQKQGGYRFNGAMQDGFVSDRDMMA